MFINEKELREHKQQKFIIDVSCDEKMAFDFAIPTTFNDPIIKLDNIFYYAVDHTPSYYYDAASYEITKSVLPYLSTLIENNIENCSVLTNATEIKNGKILNKKIIEFQGLIK
jgi:alanine dehydrogenase